MKEEGEEEARQKPGIAWTLWHTAGFAWDNSAVAEGEEEAVGGAE